MKSTLPHLLKLEKYKIINLTNFRTKIKLQKMGRLTKPKPTATLPSEEVPIKNKKQQICSIIKRKTKEKFLSESQKEYYEKLVNNQISICSGPAGVGKSYIAMKCAVDLLSMPSAT